MAFRGGVALVTGAASGMGRLAARRLAAADATVIACDINEAGLAKTADLAPNVIPTLLDVTDTQGVEDVVARTEEQHGPIGRVVHAAVIATTGRIVDVGAKEFLRINDVVYGGTVNVVAAVLPRFVARDSGDVILFASLAGWVPSPRFGAYTASKFAVVALAETIAHEHRDSDVRVCCVCPPVVKTPLLEDFELPGLVDVAGGGLKSAINPETVLDSIEDSLERGRLFAFPGPMTRTVWKLRRFAPGLVWAGWHHSTAGWHHSTD